ncbi:GlxA family transcriptional regulator [Halofilum ochraceum]|uniref:GlxA family transcriptional regulator n=1 Tax=Halofilum ochraceum TaxID=1611323 RepID=UPI0008D8DD9B|nr:GlxA family transcriptional regulator [Halofilum ochraceum]
MTEHPTSTGTREIGFLLIPEFSMMAFFAAIEPLRIANRCSGQALYSWSIWSEDGEPVAASNGMTLLTDDAIGDQVAAPTVFVCSSFNHESHTSAPIIQWLRRLAGQGVVLGGIDTGAFLLARAGLLEGHTVTLHWESIPGFRELYPGIETTTELYEVDRRRLTSSGGTATMDLMLRFIAEEHGTDLATAVSEQLIHQRVRSKSDHQRMNLAARLDVHNPTLVRAVEFMGRNIESPVPVGGVAAHCGISQRQLERLFAEQLGAGPNAYYVRLRLENARELLHDTDRSVLEVALACGFGSCASLSRAYRRQYGIPPSRDRKWTA